MASMHDKLQNLDAESDVEDLGAACEEVAGRLSDADDKLREMITKADDFKENFDDKTIKDLQDYIEQLGVELQQLKDEIY